MTVYLNRDVEALGQQLLATPVRRVWLEVISRIRETLALLDSEKSYPYEWLRFRLTAKRSTETPNDSQIPGAALVADLISLAEAVSRKAAMTVAELGEPFVTHDQLAEELSVSTKTVRRWRGRGLLGLRLLCDDAVARVVFPRSAVDVFVTTHADLVKRGASFRQLTNEERDLIIRRAQEIVAEKPTRMHAVARRISEETGRAVETIRYTLRRFEESDAGQTLFDEQISAQAVEDQAIFERVASGDSSSSIAAHYGLTEDDVDRAVLRVRVSAWKKAPPACIHNELFDAPGADELILHQPEPSAPATVEPVRIPRDVPAYLRALYSVPLLSHEQEQDIFRRYNYVKHRAAKAIARLDVDTCSHADVNEIQQALDIADGYRQRIVRANLRLVVSIARRHAGAADNFFEVVSDGNMSLMRAVEKFDYSRGFKFSTYASWAIIKNFARTIPEQHYHSRRYVTGQEEVLLATPEVAPQVDDAQDRQQVREHIAGAMAQLDDREREIITSHFGLFGQGEPLTLEQLGQRFGVTKERIRQIEHRALSRMRESMGTGLVASLT